jgi:putative oxidoreductase
VKVILLIGRILFSSIFILSSITHFSPSSIAHVANQGIPWAAFLVPLTGVIALLGGLSILIGLKAKWGAWLIVIFLIPVTFTMHQFWAYQDVMARGIQLIMFLKNISMLGGALIITYFGAGPLSVDSRLRSRAARKQT